jgi:hypothetical protein
MFVTSRGERVLLHRVYREKRDLADKAMLKLSQDLPFWCMFQIHWLHDKYASRLGPDLGGKALDGYPPCSKWEAASNLMVYAEYRFKLVETEKRRRFPLTEGLLEFTNKFSRALPGGRPGLWLGGGFHDFTALSELYDLPSRGVYDLFVQTIEDQ